MINLTTGQKDIVDATMSKLRDTGHSSKAYFNHSQFKLTVGGYAGTGKTTLICEMRKEIYRNFPHLHVAFVTFTGKASSVLQNKLKDAKINFPNDYVGTIHGLIYKPVTKYDPELKTFVIVGWDLKDKDEFIYDIIIIDEASMVSEQIWNDLVQYSKSIIAVGDHWQLPPIGDKFNLLEKPDFVLTEIHRQALNSPIIYLSKIARSQGYIIPKFYSNKVFKLSWKTPICKDIWDKAIIDENLIILCGFNTTRNYLNDLIRKRLSYNMPVPYPGERVVCLANNHNTKIMNGQIGTVLWVMPDNYDLYRMTVDMGNSEIVECMVSKKCFGQVTYTMYDKSKHSIRQRKYAISKGINQVDFFDYGYSISVHKSQGSDWQKVILFEQRSQYWDDEIYSRWLYTAITRATEKLFIITGFY